MDVGSPSDFGAAQKVSAFLKMSSRALESMLCSLAGQVSTSWKSHRVSSSDSWDVLGHRSSRDCHWSWAAAAEILMLRNVHFRLLSHSLMLNSPFCLLIDSRGRRKWRLRLACSLVCLSQPDWHLAPSLPFSQTVLFSVHTHTHTHTHHEIQPLKPYVSMPASYIALAKIITNHTPRYMLKIHVHWHLYSCVRGGSVFLKMIVGWR